MESWFKPTKKSIWTIGIGKPIKKNKVKTSKKNMNWDQAKQRYPRLKPFGDADRDGVKNIFDCRPFNKKKQGFQHQYSFSSVASKKIRTVKMPPELFIKTTYGESMRNNRTQEEREKNVGPYNRYVDDLTHGAGGIVHRGRYFKYVKGEMVRLPLMAKETGMKRRIESKTEHVPVPFLEFNEEGRPIGHEGRHTALVAQRMGLKFIPVTIERPKGTKLTSKYERLEPIKGKEWIDQTDKRLVISKQELEPAGTIRRGPNRERTRQDASGGLAVEHPSNKIRRQRYEELREKGFSRGQAARARDFRPTTYQQVNELQRDVNVSGGPSLEELRRMNIVDKEAMKALEDERNMKVNLHQDGTEIEVMQQVPQQVTAEELVEQSNPEDINMPANEIQTEYIIPEEPSQKSAQELLEEADEEYNQ